MGGYPADQVRLKKTAPSELKRVHSQGKVCNCFSASAKFTVCAQLLSAMLKTVPHTVEDSFAVKVRTRPRSLLASATSRVTIPNGESNLQKLFFIGSFLVAWQSGD